jgi:hypothetical protein
MKTDIYTNSVWLGKEHTKNTAEFVAFVGPERCKKHGK